jgi:hypothetical protein
VEGPKGASLLMGLKKKKYEPKRVTEILVAIPKEMGPWM